MSSSYLARNLVRTTLAQLSMVEKPVKTDTYQPIGHDTLINYIRASLVNTLPNYVISNEYYSMTVGGQEMYAQLTLSPIDENGNIDQAAIAANHDLLLSIGIVNSYNKRLRVQFITGAANAKDLAMYYPGGSIAFMRKHTPKSIPDVQNAIEDILRNTNYAYNNVLAERIVLSYVSADEKAVYSILGMIFGYGGLTTPQLNQVLKFYRKYKQENDQDLSLWDLYSVIAKHVKTIRPSKMLEAQSIIHQVVADYVQIK